MNEYVRTFVEIFKRFYETVFIKHRYSSSIGGIFLGMVFIQ